MADVKLLLELLSEGDPEPAKREAAKQLAARIDAGEPLKPAAITPGWQH